MKNSKNRVLLKNRFYNWISYQNISHPSKIIFGKTFWTAYKLKKLNAGIEFLIAYYQSKTKKYYNIIPCLNLFLTALTSVSLPGLVFLGQVLE
jgi:hypothetical protein